MKEPGNMAKYIIVYIIWPNIFKNILLKKNKEEVKSVLSLTDLNT